jgi:eukaryotic-like serine/threonine-protein kinase
MPTRTSTTIGGRYVLREELGRGAMGVVWRAHDSTLNRDVALKEIELPAAIDPAERDALTARVMREARAAARLSSPSAVTVFDVVEQDDRPWLVMELVGTETLEDRVNAAGPLDAISAARLGLSLVDALEAAHAAGIVHRDVKPANVMVAESGTAKLADFGIASLKDDPKITATGLVLGSPSYMAPEQAHTQDSGPAADIWSLGATLYFAVEGRPPFDKGSALPTLTAVIEDEPPPARRAGPLAPLITALLAKDPTARPDHQAIRDALSSVVDGGAARSVLEAPAPEEAEVTTRVDTAPPRAPERSPAGRGAGTSGRGKWLAIAAGIVLVASIVLLIVSQLSSSNTEPRRAPTGGGANGTPKSRARVPAAWETYEDPTAGWSIERPPEWQVIPGSIDDTSVDFRDPVTHAYLRVDWTTTPGDSAVEAWRQQAASFAQSHSDYAEIGIAPDTFDGWPAATWEFTYSESGAMLHAIDLGFVVRDEYGFALYFQTHEEDWDTSQPTFEQLKSSFEAPS